MTAATTRPAPVILGLLLGAGAVLGARVLLGHASDQGTEGQPVVPAASVAAPLPSQVALPDRESPAVVQPLVSPAVGEASASADSDGRQAGILVHGLVTEASGAVPVPGPWGTEHLRFSSDTGESRDVKLEPSGSYAASGLRPGLWRVQLTARGHVPLDRTLALSADEPVRRFDLIIDSAVTLLVRAFAQDGRPLREMVKEQLAGLDDEHGLGVVATRDAPGAELTETGRPLDRYGIGRYRAGGRLFGGEPDLPPDALGRLEIHEPLPAFVSLVFRGFVLQTQLVEPGADSVTFTVPVDFIETRRGGLRVRIIDAPTAAPLLGALANLTETNSFRFGGGQEPDAGGIVSWERELPGLRRLQIDCEGHEQWVAKVRVPAGDVADLGTVALDEVAHVGGVVRDADGAPQHASVIIFRADSVTPTHTIPDPRWFETDEDGSFRFDDLGRREYELRVSPTDWVAQPVRVSTRAGAVDDVVVIVEQGTEVRFDCQWPSTRLYDVEIQSRSGDLSMPRRSIWGADPMARRMFAGSYKAMLFDGATLVREMPFEVQGDKLLVTLARP